MCMFVSIYLYEMAHYNKYGTYNKRHTPRASDISTDEPAVTNSGYTHYKNRNGANVQEFHEKNIQENFILVPVCHVDDASIESVVECRKKIKALDNLANPVKNHRKQHVQKPFFRYISRQLDGSLKCHGGGFFLYVAWDTNTGNDVVHADGSVFSRPVYFRAKSAVINSVLPNFSVQFDKVVSIYYQPPCTRDDPDVVVRGAGKLIRFSGKDV